MRHSLLAATLLTALVAGCKAEAPTTPAASSEAASAAASQADARFAELSKRWLEGWLPLNPVSATQIGDHRFDAELDDVSAAGRQRALHHAAAGMDEHPAVALELLHDEALAAEQAGQDLALQVDADLHAARAEAARNPALLAWKDGMGDWLPVRNIAELVDGVPGDPASAPPPPPRNGGKGRADEIDFRIHGQEMQFVEIELDPGESAIAEAGSLMFKDSSVQMDTVFGDGSASGQSGGFMDKLLSAGKRVITGESLFTTLYTHGGSGKAKVAFAAPYPGTVMAMKLDEHGGRIICQKDSFLAGARGVQVHRAEALVAGGVVQVPLAHGELRGWGCREVYAARDDRQGAGSEGLRGRGAGLSGSPRPASAGARSAPAARRTTAPCRGTASH